MSEADRHRAGRPWSPSPTDHRAGGHPARGFLSAKLWSIGILLIALGIAARMVGWDALLWIPAWILQSLAWVPLAALDAVRSDPATFGLIALGVVCLLVARLIGRRRG